MSRLSLFLAFLLVVTATPALSADDEVCQLVSRICAEGPETRVIDGVDVYRECWRYEEEHFCRSQQQINTCEGLGGSCVVTADTCLATDPSGYCVLTEKTYSCGTKQPDDTTATYLDSSYTVVKDEIDASACQSYQDNVTCSQTGSVCVEGEETRIINGLPVYKACWRWDKQYTCYTDAYKNYCEPLETVCTQTQSECKNSLADGTCAIETLTFDCDESQPAKEGVKFIDTKYTITDEYWEGTCDSVDPECIEQGKVCVEGPETRNIDGALIYRDCWRYEKSFACLTGEPEDMCNGVDLSVCKEVGQRCVAYDTKGRCISNSIEYECTYKYEDSTVIDCSNQMFCMGDDCYDTGYEPNNEFGLAAAYLGAATQAGEQITEDSIDIFSGHKSTCSKFAASSVDCCDDSGWANGSFSGCSNEDKKLIEERKAKLTHFVGTYCAKKLKPFNVCIEYRESYCTFNSMLARIVQEGARPQLSMDWGSAKAPTCNGLKPEHFDHIDFTLIDFTEYINEMKVDMVDNGELAKTVEDKVSQFLGN